MSISFRQMYDDYSNIHCRVEFFARPIKNHVFINFLIYYIFYCRKCKHPIIVQLCLIQNFPIVTPIRIHNIVPRTTARVELGPNKDQTNLFERKKNEKNKKK